MPPLPQPRYTDVLVIYCAHDIVFIRLETPLDRTVALSPLPSASSPFRPSRRPTGHVSMSGPETKDHPVFGRNSHIDFAILGDRVLLYNGSSRVLPAHLIAPISIDVIHRLVCPQGQTPVMVVLKTTLFILLEPGNRRDMGTCHMASVTQGLGRLRILGTSSQSAPHLKIFIEMMPGAGLHRASALPMNPSSERSGLFPDAVFLDPGRGGCASRPNPDWIDCNILGL
ncbi:hypothetical protein FFLO_02116 [Filobasidium floriforme]|uniref:Uncharacterized protein n=1 Tax=Filobasidium floriforme TaxID=5210 RepID=A0A8K0NUA5_9TREE|nr:hypothetical protein FFLO_02116 [Filobasidium floriforme]